MDFYLGTAWLSTRRGCSNLFVEVPKIGYAHSSYALLNEQFQLSEMERVRVRTRKRIVQGKSGSESSAL